MRFALCLTILLAGCLTGDRPGAAETSPETAAEPVWITLYLDAEGDLVPELPIAAAVGLDWSYAQWLDGTPPPKWTSAATSALRIVAGNISLYYQADKATLSGDVRPELTAWWGSEETIVDHVFVEGASIAAPGDIVAATAALRVPAGGLVLAPDSRHLLRVGTYYADGPVLGTIDLLVGGAAASRLDLLVEPVSWQAMRSDIILDETGTVRGGRCAATVNPTEEADSYHDVMVDETVLGFHVVVESQQAIPTSDIDLVVYGPNGTVVGGGHSSFGIEGATVWASNLAVDGSGTYRIRVLASTPRVTTDMLALTKYTADPSAS